jgi:hypothetical protein
LEKILNKYKINENYIIYILLFIPETEKININDKEKSIVLTNKIKHKMHNLDLIIGKNKTIYCFYIFTYIYIRKDLLFKI